MCEIYDNPKMLDALNWCIDKEWTLDGTLKNVTDSSLPECRASCMIENPEWDYYKMSCGHIYHTRCIRAHLYYKKKLNCCLCGDLEENKWFCNFCNEDNHYEGKQWVGQSNFKNECFLSGNRMEIVDIYKKQGTGGILDYILDNEYRYYDTDIGIVVKVYKRLNAKECFDWRSVLSKCIDKRWHAV